MRHTDTQKKAPEGAIDWHPADIKAALEKIGWTLRGLDRANGYGQGTLKKVLVKSYPAAQVIIANVLGMEPWTIWPSRYRDGVPIRQRPNHPLQRKHTRKRHGAAPEISRRKRDEQESA
ncbi:MAG: helix-turn-helix domain-containing protein [Magnetococcales bacterium]|nr:helix-turn-helix domain-containing protein [Magnetococcales bacterium]MBF0322735.1 helix-turn-helix domain-containing protein [Magnetococcales bacterium]